MNLLLDTNILVFISRTKDTDSFVDFINPENATLYISVASEAEIKSIALKIIGELKGTTSCIIS